MTNKDTMSTPQMRALAAYWKTKITLYFNTGDGAWDTWTDEATRDLDSICNVFNTQMETINQEVKIKPMRRWAANRGIITKCEDAYKDTNNSHRLRSISFTTMRLIDDNQLSLDLVTDGPMLEFLKDQNVITQADYDAAVALGQRQAPLRRTLDPPCNKVWPGHLEQILAKKERLLDEPEPVVPDP